MQDDSDNESEHGSESAINWLARLKNMCLYCKFDVYLDNIIKDKFICGLLKGSVFKKVIEAKHDATLDKCVEVFIK